MLHVGHVIRQLRKDRRWTQTQLAKRAGLGLMTVSDAETGRKSSLETIEKLAHALGTTPDQLTAPIHDAVSASPAALRVRILAVFDDLVAIPNAQRAALQAVERVRSLFVELQQLTAAARAHDVRDRRDVDWLARLEAEAQQFGVAPGVPAAARAKKRRRAAAR